MIYIRKTFKLYIHFASLHALMHIVHSFPQLLNCFIFKNNFQLLKLLFNKQKNIIFFFEQVIKQHFIFTCLSATFYYVIPLAKRKTILFLTTLIKCYLAACRQIKCIIKSVQNTCMCIYIYYDNIIVLCFTFQTQTQLQKETVKKS